jgi:hypothetical protein
MTGASRVVRVRACCDLDVHLGTARVRVAHENDCSALNPSHPTYVAARTKALLAVQKVMEENVAPTMLLLGTDGSEALLVGGDDE